MSQLLEKNPSEPCVWHNWDISSHYAAEKGFFSHPLYKNPVDSFYIPTNVLTLFCLGFDFLINVS